MPFKMRIKQKTQTKFMQDIYLQDLNVYLDMKENFNRVW